MHVTIISDGVEMETLKERTHISVEVIVTRFPKIKEPHNQNSQKQQQQKPHIYKKSGRYYIALHVADPRNPSTLHIIP